MKASPTLSSSASRVSPGALKYWLKSVASTISPRPHAKAFITRVSLAAKVSGAISAACAERNLRGWGASGSSWGRSLRAASPPVRPYLPCLVDVGALHQAQADVGVPQAVSRAALAFAVEFEFLLFDDAVQEDMLVVRDMRWSVWPCSVYAIVDMAPRRSACSCNSRRRACRAPSISKMRSLVSRSFTMVTSRYSSRLASSGRRPILAMKMMKS